MKIVMLAVVAALTAAPACAEAAGLVYHPSMQNQHMMQQPRSYFRPSMQQHHMMPRQMRYFRPPMHHERIVSERRRMHFERPIAVQRRHYGRDGFYGNDANGDEDLGEGENFQTGVYRHWEHHERHRVVHISAPRVVTRECGCNCCCQEATSAALNPSPDVIEGPTQADYDLVRRVYKSIGQ